MLIGHSPRALHYVAATCLLVVVGCAQPGPLLSRRTTLGTLKTGLSHVEFENEQLRSKVAKLESENREIEDRLVQEEAINGDLTARLDDARNLLGHSELDWGDSTRSTRRKGPSGDESTSRTLPAGRSNRSPRKPPFAQIPGRIDVAPPAENEESSRPGMLRTDPLGPQSWRDDDAQWLPIAQGTNGPTSKVR
jgi:hypothetical protein